MHSDVCSPTFGPVSADPVVGRLPIREVECLLSRVTASWHGSAHAVQSRRWHRVRCEGSVVLTPLDDATGRPVGERKRATARDVSLGGFSFTHLDPLPFRRVVVTFGVGTEEVASAVLRLSWCRFLSARLYQSGGRFLNVVPTPFGDDVCLDDLRHA
jgi:hypothetical protein